MVETGLTLGALTLIALLLYRARRISREREQEREKLEPRLRALGRENGHLV